MSLTMIIVIAYYRDRALSVSNSAYGGGSGPILLDDLKCTGTEQNILQCGNKGFYINNCDHTEDVGVVCNSGKSVRNNQQKLGTITVNISRTASYHEDYGIS